MTTCLRAIFVAALLSTVPLAVSIEAFASEPINETRSFTAGGVLTIRNVSGEVVVEAWNKDMVEITGELGRKSRLEISENSRGLRIEVETEGGNWGFDGPGETYLTIQAPVSAQLEVSGVSASVRIEGFRSNSLEAETVSGDIEVDVQVERLDLESVSGDVEFRGQARRTSAETVSGDVELEGIEGELDVSMVSGDLELSSAVLSSGQFESVSGNLEMHISVLEAGRLRVESMSGDVTLYLPGNQQGEFSAQSFSGNVRSKFGEVERVSRGPGKRLDYINGDGSAEIRVETFSGDIDIRQH